MKAATPRVGPEWLLERRCGSDREHQQAWLLPLLSYESLLEVTRDFRFGLIDSKKLAST